MLISEIADVRDARLSDYFDERNLAHQIGLRLGNGCQARFTEAERRALMWYRDHGYKAINRALRGESLIDLKPYILNPEDQLKDYKFTITVDEAVALLDSAIAKCAVGEAVAVYRGFTDAGPAADRIAGMKVGQSFVDPAFVSTTLHHQFAYTGYAHAGNGFVMRILVPAGAHAIYVSHDDGSEAEVLLGRGRRYTLKGKRRMKPIASHLPPYVMGTFVVS